MVKLKSKAVLRMAIFAIIMTMVLWLMPVGIISAEGSSLADLQAAADTANANLEAAGIALGVANANLAAAQAGQVEQEIIDAQALVDTALLDLAAAQTAADAAKAALAAAQPVINQEPVAGDSVGAAGDVGMLCHHSIFLQKSYDRGDGGPASFELYKDGVLVPGSEKTASSPCYSIQWPGLEAGRYTVQEVNIPFGYSCSIDKPFIDITGANWNTAPDSAFRFTAVNTLQTCRINIFKTIDGAPATEGIFSFEVTQRVSAGGELSGANVSPNLIPPSFTLDSTNSWGASFDAICGVEYTITEIGPPSGFTFDFVVSDFSHSINGQSITFTANCGQSVSPQQTTRPPYGTITFNNLKTIPGSNLLRLVKVSSATGLPLAGAVYSLYIGSTLIYDLLPTGADGATLVSLPNLNTVYTIREKTPPPGYALDPTSYTVTAGSDPITIALNVKDDPLGGDETVTVAAITEGIEVLAFTGIDPILPISGGSIILSGIAMLAASLKRRNKHSAKHTAGKTDKEDTKWWESIL